MFIGHSAQTIYVAIYTTLIITNKNIYTTLITNTNIYKTLIITNTNIYTTLIITNTKSDVEVADNLII